MGLAEFEIYCLFEVLRGVGKVAYKLALSASLSAIHLVFHVPMLKKYVSDGSQKL